MRTGIEGALRYAWQSPAVWKPDAPWLLYGLVLENLAYKDNINCLKSVEIDPLRYSYQSRLHSSLEDSTVHSIERS